jgi:hypothetical protein
MVICDLLSRIRLALSRFKNSKDLEETFVFEGLHVYIEVKITKKRKLELLKPLEIDQDSA